MQKDTKNYQGAQQWEKKKHTRHNLVGKRTFKQIKTNSNIV